MKWILNVFLLMIFVTTSTISIAAEGESNSNYVSVNPIANMSDLNKVDSKCATLDYNGKHVVDPKDFSICENDISYGILQMVFQKIFAENEILSALADHETGNESLAYAYNIGGPIIAIIEAVTWLTFTISGLTLTFVMIKTLNISASSGQFMGNWNSVFVMTRTLGAMALIVPIGSFSIAQIIILVLSLFAIMGGNYIWGAFLSMQQVGSIMLEKSDMDNISLSEEQAESLVKTSTCSLRTSSLSVQQNQSNLGNYFFRSDVDTHMSRLSSCSRNNYFVGVDQSFESYNGTDITGLTLTDSYSNAFPLSTVAMGSPNYCNGVYDLINKYDEDVYGKNYQCGYVSFNTADLEKYVDNDSEVGNEPWYKSTKSTIVNTVRDMTRDVDPNALYNQISTKGRTNALSGVVFNISDYETEVDTLKTAFVERGSDVFNRIKLNLNSNSPNPPAAYEGTFVALSAIFNNYLGGTYNSNAYDEFWEKFKSVEIELTEFKGSVNKAVQIYTDKELSLGLSGMYSDSKLAAGYVNSAQCAKIWPTYYSSYDSSVEYLNKLKPNENDLMKDNLGLGTLSSECIVALNDSNISTDLSLTQVFLKLPDATGGDSNDQFYLSMADVPNMGYRQILIESSTNQDQELIDKAAEEIRVHSIKNANAIIDGMKAYNYVIRASMEKALEEIFIAETDTDFLVNMRDLGWASAGGFILSISNNGSEIGRYNKIIQSQISWSSANSNDKYIHSIALMNSDETFSSMYDVTKNIFSDASSNLDYEDLESRDTYEMSMSEVYKYLEDMLTAPLSHLKAVGGFDQNKTIRDGARACYENGQCTITQVHPVTALLNVGNDLIDLCFNLIILKTITGVITMFSTSEELGGSDAKMKGGKGGSKVNVMGALLKGNPFTRIIIKIAEIVDPILGIITTVIVPPLFIVGIFFSFVIPMMPFLAFLMGFIGWLMLILELLIAVNVWILLMATPDQNGNSRADPRAVFSFVGQLVLKPGLMVVGLIFGWYLSAISVYFLNMTIFGALSPTESGSFIGLLDVFMFYIVYLIMIFIAIKHSFKIIEILPDKIFTLINISKSGDVKSENLGMERLVQLAAGEKVLSLATTPMNMIDKKKEKLKYDLEAYNRSLMNKGIDDADNVTRNKIEGEEAAKKAADSAAKTGSDKSDELLDNAGVGKEDIQKKDEVPKEKNTD